MKNFWACAGSALALMVAVPASATVVIGTGAGTIQPDENVLFNNNPPNGLTVQGITNQSGTLVSITGGETLAGSGGQARLDAADGLIDTTFDVNGGPTDQLLLFDLADAGLAFTEAEFRLFGGTATQATLTFFDTDGESFTGAFAIPSNGFFNAFAVDNQQIDYFTVAANGSIGDVRQIRIGGIGDILSAIPEPESWALMILGFGGIGATLRQRRRSAFA